MDALVQTAIHTQKIAHQTGAAQMAVEVFGWAIKHSGSIPTSALKELMDMITGEPK